MRTIDISGWQGNAFSLMGYAKDFGRQLEFSNEKIEQIVDDMKSDDYMHLLNVFNKHYGDVVELVGGSDLEDDEEDDHDPLNDPDYANYQRVDGWSHLK